MQVSEFVTRGSIRDVSRRIETHAAQAQVVSALVVPWESDTHTVRLAVTSVKADGWAIDHINLGTIEVTALPDDRSRIVVIAGEPASDDVPEPAAVLGRFATELERLLDEART